LKNLISINEFYSIRIGSTSAISNGNYIDNIHKNEWISIAYCGDDNDILLIEGAQLKTALFEQDHFWDISQKIPNQSSIDPLLFIGLLRSATDKDFDGLVDSGVSEGSIFFANDTDIVKPKSSTLFAVCSFMSSFSGIFFDQNLKFSSLSNDTICNLNDLFGLLEEDESWVVGVST
jgi:hypothetical protein